MKSKTNHVRTVKEGVDTGLKPPKLNKFHEMMDVYKGDKALVNFQTDEQQLTKAQSIKKKFKMTFLQLIYNNQVLYKRERVLLCVYKSGYDGWRYF